MDVEVKDILASGLAGGALYIHALRREGRLQQGGDTMHHDGDLPIGDVRDLPHITGMLPRNDQGVAWKGGPDVQERNGVLVVEYAIGRQSARHDLAEGAVAHRLDDRSQPAVAKPTRRKRLIGRAVTGFVTPEIAQSMPTHTFYERSQMGRDSRVWSDSGSLTLMLAVLMVALLALAGLVIDGGRKLDATQKAYAIAQEAARAGAGQVNTSAAYRSGNIRVDRQQALAAARSYLASAGYRGSVSASGNRIRVTVRVSERTAVLSLIGIKTFTTSGSAVASLVTGVAGPGS